MVYYTMPLTSSLLRQFLFCVFCILSFLGMTTLKSSAGEILDSIKKRGIIHCGVSNGLAGFSAPDKTGNFTGFDVDMCRLTAAALFGDAQKVRFIPLSAKDRFTALQAGEVDILSRNTTWTLSRDSQLALAFTMMNFFDGQGFIVRKSANISKPEDLKGATLCTETGTTTELNVADYFRTRNIEYKLLVFQKADEAVAAYEKGRCDAFTNDKSGLAIIRLKFENPDDHMILKDMISKEPFAVAVRQGDDQWFDIVKWAQFAVLDAEELGINSQNVDDMRANSLSPEVRRFLGVDGELGKTLGLPNEWAYTAIKQVGNYSEIFDRNLGENSPLKMERGYNRLWKDGGLLVAPPIR
jgi:general L-amino acid transport system substrate-binding protein